MNVYQASEAPRVADIVAAASRITMIPQCEITGPQRKIHIVRVRHAVSLVAYKLGHSYSAIGRTLNRDHTTVINAVEQAEELAKSHAAFRILVGDIGKMSAKIAKLRRDELLGAYSDGGDGK